MGKKRLTILIIFYFIFIFSQFLTINNDNYNFFGFIRPHEVRQVVGFIEPRHRQRERNEVQRKPRDVFIPSAPENLST